MRTRACDASLMELNFILAVLWPERSMRIKHKHLLPPKSQVPMPIMSHHSRFNIPVWSFSLLLTDHHRTSSRYCERWHYVRAWTTPVLKKGVHWCRISRVQTVTPILNANTNQTAIAARKVHITSPHEYKFNHVVLLQIFNQRLNWGQCFVPCHATTLNMTS